MALRKVSVFQTITFSFFLVILLGSILLCLPVSWAGEGRCSFLDALFTSSSAVCVTGLVVHNTATYWSLFGQSVILVLIQIGGLGVITVVIALSIFSGKRIGLRQRNLMQNAVNAHQIGGIIRFTRFLLLFTILTESLGAVLLSPVFIRKEGLAEGIRRSVFHSVSAFCNAGFDILGDKTSYVSLMDYKGDILLNLVIMALIVIGGLGFFTWDDLIRKRFRWRKLKLQTKLVLTVTAILLSAPAVLFFIFEFGDSSLKERILMSVFSSVTTRTAGFNTARIDALSECGRMLMIFLMLVGGSPGSTAGGMKTTTLALILFMPAGFIRRKKDCTAFGRSIAAHTIQEAYTLFVLYLTLFFTGSLLICRMEGLPLLDCMFETASALGTVGLSVGITPSLKAISKMILILFMYFGRVGGLTLAYSALRSMNPTGGKLPEEKITVG